MPTNVNTAVSPSIQPAGRTTGAKTDRIAINKDGGSSSPFAKQTDVKFTNSVDNMSAVLDKIANSRMGVDAVLPRQLQQMINNVVRNAFSLENSLSGGLGSAISSERYSLEQLTTLGRIFQQLGNMAEADAAAASQLLGTQNPGSVMAGELTDALQILMANIKNIIGESYLSGNTGSLDLVQLNKLAFQLVNGGSAEGLPEDIVRLLQQLSGQLAAGQTGVAAQQGSEETGMLKQLIDVLFPRPLTSGQASSGSVAGSGNAGTGADAGGSVLNGGDAAANANAAANTNANSNAGANANAGTGTSANANINANSNAGLNAQQVIIGQAANGQMAAGQAAAGSNPANTLQGQTNAGSANGGNAASSASNANNANSAGNAGNANNYGGAQGGAGAAGEGSAVRGEQTAFRPDGSGQGMVNPRGSSTAQQVSELERNPLFRQIFNRYGYTQETGVVKNSMHSQQSQPYIQLANNQQTVAAFKDMAQLLLKDSTMSARDVQLLQNFVNGSHEALSHQDAKQLKLLLRMVQSNIPAAIQQAGQQQGMDGLPKLWAFLQLAELGTLKDIKAKDLKKASREVKTVISSMKGAVSSEGSYRADGQKSISFVMPLYIGGGEQSYPAYINLYDEQPHEDERGRMRKDTWFRVCVLTENIGAVDIVCQLYEGNNLNLRIQFSDPDVVRDFGEYLPDIRKALYDTPIHLNDLKVGTVK